MATSWYSYFDGSDFYSRRSKYRTQLLESAKNVIKNYELETYIYDTSGTYTLTDEEYTYLQNNYDSYYAELKAKYQPTTGEFSISGRIVSYTRYGVKRYTDIRGEQKARLETQYIMDMIDPVTVSLWLAGIAAGIALTAFFGAGWAMIAAIIVQIVAAISEVVFYVLDLVQKTTTIGLTASILSESVKNAYLSSANEFMESKDLDAGDLLIWKGTDAFAGGDIYMAQSPGSNNSYTPSLAYNPSSRFTGMANKDNYSLAGDYTQGRNHYKMAGNEGYFKQIAPKLQLAKINDLNPDYEYKLNSYKNHTERILRGYSALAEYIGTDDDNDSTTWINSWYEYENENYKNIYYTYTQSKDVLDKINYYPKALRADLDFYSQWQEERDSARESTTTATQSDISEGITIVTEDDLSESISESDNQASALFDLWLQSQMIAEQEEYQYYDTESKEFLEYKLAFFEGLDINYLINAGVLDGIISGYLTTGASDEEYLNFYTQDYITDAYKAYILAMYSGLSLSFDASVCKDALGYYFGLFSSSYDSSFVIGMDIDTFLDEDYSAHQIVKYATYTFTLSFGYVVDDNAYNYGTDIYLSTEPAKSGGTRDFSFQISEQVILAMIETYKGKGSVQATYNVNSLGLAHKIYYIACDNSLDGSPYLLSWDSFDIVFNITSNKTTIQDTTNIQKYYLQNMGVQGGTSYYTESFCINNYYDSEEVYNAALEWLESEKESLKEQIESAKTQAEIQAEIAASLE